MDNPVRLATLGTLDTGRGQIKQETKIQHNTDKHMKKPKDPTKPEGKPRTP